MTGKMIDSRKWRNRVVEKLGLAVVSASWVKEPMESGVVVGIKPPTITVRFADGSEQTLYSDLFEPDAIPYIDAVDADEDGMPIVHVRCHQCHTVFNQCVAIEEVAGYEYDPANRLYYHRTLLCLDCDEAAK
jgi:hypothetical protein